MEILESNWGGVWALEGKTLRSEPPLQKHNLSLTGFRTGKTNLSHDGPNPAHVSFWWVSNPTLWDSCAAMIGCAGTEGSKSNVPMTARLSHASYPGGNFFDTSS